jgi:hypothetical protein
VKFVDTSITIRLFGCRERENLVLVILTNSLEGARLNAVRAAIWLKILYPLSRFSYAQNPKENRTESPVRAEHAISP